MHLHLELFFSLVVVAGLVQKKTQNLNFKKIPRAKTTHGALFGPVSLINTLLSHIS